MSALGTLLALLERCPPALVYRSMEGLAFLWHAMDRRHRVLARANAAQALGGEPSDRSIRRLVRASFRSNARVAADLILMPRLADPDRLETWLDTSDVGPLVAGRQPSLVVAGHMGPWEMLPVTIPLWHGPTAAIGRPLSNPTLDRFVNGRREMFGTRMLPRRGGVRSMVAALTNGESAGVLMDQNQHRRPLFVEWLGRVAATDRSAAVLSARLQVPVRVVAVVRMGRGFRFKLLLGKELPPCNEDPQVYTRKILEALEQLVLAHPDQYFWVHNRYRTRPPDETG